MLSTQLAPNPAHARSRTHSTPTKRDRLRRRRALGRARPRPQRPAKEAYGRYCRPKLADLLRCLRLDLPYEKASGSYVFYREERNSNAKEVPVLDLVSGFGACLLGHNNPELKKALIRQLDRNVPMLTQSAVRVEAGRLAERLNQLVPAKGEYKCNFSNSGAEAVEAAMKHAYKVRFDAIRRDYERISRQINDTCARIEEEELEVELPVSGKEVSKFRDDLEESNLAQFEAFRQAPVVIALKGSFHGKTSSALKVTFNKSYREGYEGLSAIQPVFVDPEQVERLPEIVEEQQIELLVPRIDGDRVVLDRVKMTKAIAFVFEVIIGEGGIRPLSEASLETLARVHAGLGIPYIIDEVQTGCGRTGAIFAYSQTPLARIEPDYITLSKALGGGLVKIGATLIHERVYDPDFGILHTSTFAEDDLSCSVACEVLEILTRDHGSLMTQVQQKGAYLIERLRRLQQRYPQVIREVRGRGLMIGIEFQQLQDRSPLFRYAGKQGFLSLLVASYLLHQHQIRVLAPLTTLLKGNPGKKRQSVMRVQPPACITHGEIDQLVSALDEVLNVIDKNNEYLLVAHLIGQDPSQTDRLAPVPLPVARPLPRRREDFDARIGFVLHPTALAQVLEFYFPSFSNYGTWDKTRVERWWTELSRFLEPDVAHVEYIKSGGFIVEANFVVVPFLPPYMMKVFNRTRKNKGLDRPAQLRLTEIQDKVQDAVTVARELGDDHVPTSMVGLGAFTSVVTRQGTTINDYEVPVTTGNAYTAALMVQSIGRAAGILGLDLQDATCAVVGAAGNIGAVLASTLCAQIGRVKLIGRRQDDGTARLAQARITCMCHVLERVAAAVRDGQAPAEIELDGLSGVILRDLLRPCLADADADPGELLRELRPVLTGAVPVTPKHGMLLDRAVCAHYRVDENPFVSLHTDCEDVGDCDVVAIATNSTNGQLITPDKVKRGAIVCSASVPSDLCRSFRDQLDNYFVFDGGLARLPEGNVIDWVGLPKAGLAFGCLSEALLLGFDGHNQTFAKGHLKAQQVQRVLEMAEDHDFSLGEFKLAERVHPLAGRRINGAEENR